MPNRLDMTGKRFGRLTVLSDAGNDKHRRSVWRVRCDCGTEFVAVGSAIRGGWSKSCGCLRADRFVERTRAMNRSVEHRRRLSESLRGRKITWRTGRAAEPLESRIAAKSMPVPWTGCVLWLGHVDKNGYGSLSVKVNGKHLPRRAHRVAYELARGPIPSGMVLDHRCRVTCCINPDHLEPVTAKENVLRGHGFAARNAGKTHCPRGHELLVFVAEREPSLKIRACLECRNARARERMRARKAKHYA